MTKVSAAYIAGFFDGEGCIYLRKSRSQYRPVYRINIAQSQVEVLRWIQKRLGYGRIYGPYARNQYTLTITRKADVVNFAELVLPYCHVKKPALQHLLEVIQ